MKPASEDYLGVLRERSKTSRVYKNYQSEGLALAEILDDRKHKALYIKLAKEHNAGKLIALAKDIASRKTVQNRGAYFMKMFQQLKTKKCPVEKLR